jgi:hypothetical protein
MPEKPQKKSAIEKIMQGLQVAQAVYGVKSAYDQNKIRNMQIEAAEKDAERQKRISEGDFTEQEASQLYRVEPETKGSMVGYVNRIERTPGGQILYDETSGQPLTKKEKFYYISKDAAQIQSYLDKQSEFAQRQEDIRTWSEGGIPKKALMEGKVKGISTKQVPGAIKSWYRDETGNKVDIWVDPVSYKNIKSGGGLDVAGDKYPDWAKKDRKLMAGYSSAIRAGIANPTETDALNYSPEFIDEKLKLYDKAVEREDYDLYAALNRVDQLINIDGKNQNESIPGVTDISGYAPATGFTGALYKGTLGEEQRKNISAIDGVINLILKMRSGAAITPQEAERLKSELEMAYGKRSAAGVRNVMAQVRDKLRVWVEKSADRLPPMAKQSLKDSKSSLSPWSPLFRKTSEKSDEEAAQELYGE